MFGGSLSLSKEADRKKKKDAELRRVKAAQAAADQHLLQQKREVDRRIEKLAAPKAAGKSMRAYNRGKAKRMRRYDRLPLCVFCTQFYDHHVLESVKNM